MKKHLFLISLMILVCGSVSAQSFLQRLGQKAKEAAQSAISEKVENAAKSGVDKAADILTGKNKSNSNSSSNSSSTAAENQVPDTPELAMSSEDNDFVPGSIVLFEDNLVGEKIGEFPSKWDISEGSVGVNRLGDRTVIKFDNNGGRIMPLMEKDMYSYLPDVFTLEFDIYLQKNQGDVGNMNFELGLMSREEDANTHNGFCAWLELRYSPWATDGYYVSYHCQKPSGDSVDGEAWNEKTHMKPGCFNHIAVSFNKRAFKVYINGFRVVNVPNMLAPKYLQFVYGDVENYPYCVLSNVRLAKGGVDLYDRNASDLTAAAAAVEKSMKESGKFVTNNILFESGKATLKPESMVDIQSVAEYMKKNPNVRFEVQGHCDNQGSDKVNDPLSQKRAEAIVAELVKLGVDEWNLRAVGKGSHEPVADNKTEAGRAQNRRVEFIKK